MEALPDAARPSDIQRLSAGKRLGLLCAVFLLSRLLVAVSAAVAWRYFPKNPDAQRFLAVQSTAEMGAWQYFRQTPDPADILPHQRFIDLFHRADANWFADVIEKGYWFREDKATGKAYGNVAFYPVYPVLVREVRRIVPDTAIAGHLVSNVALLVACGLLWKLAAFELRSGEAATWAVAFALFCPGGAWLSMVFSESCFLTLLLVVLLAARQKRWLLAAAGGYLLTLTRTVGVMAAVFVALEIFEEWRERRRAASSGNGQPFSMAEWMARLLALAVPLLGYATFLGFLQWRFGDWHAQHKALAASWPAAASISTPWAAFAREWGPMPVSKRLMIYGLLTAGAGLSALTCPALRRWSYPAMCFAFLAIYVTATNHSPMARYLSVVAPIYLALGWLAARYRALGWGMLAASAALMALLTGLMVNGYVFY